MIEKAAEASPSRRMPSAKSVCVVTCPVHRDNRREVMIVSAAL